MNIKDFYNGFKNVSLAHTLVNDVITGDIYKLNKETHKYPLTCIGIQNITKIDNATTYNCILYYVDRLIENHSNETEIHTTANTTLQQIINKMAESDLSLDYAYGTYTLFNQKFADECAGAYVNATFTTLDSVGLCSDFIYNPPVVANLQAKTINPSFETQLILPDDGYDGLSKVTANKMNTFESIDLIQPNIILNKANSGTARTNNYTVDAKGLAITPYIRIYPEEWGKSCVTLHSPRYKSLADLDGITGNYATNATLVFTTQPKYNDAGEELHPDIINYEEVSLSSIPQCPLYADYWQINRTFTIANNIYWIRFTFDMYNSYGMKFMIGDRVLYESKIDLTPYE